MYISIVKKVKIQLQNKLAVSSGGQFHYVILTEILLILIYFITMHLSNCLAHRYQDGKISCA